MHPLHKYPGPLLAKLTEWYGAYYALRLRLHLITYADHQKYGELRINDPTFPITNRSRQAKLCGMDRINSSSTPSRHCTTSIIMSDLENHTTIVSQTSEHHNIFNVLDKNVHRHKRKIIGRCVSERSMRGFEPIMIRHIDTLITQLAHSRKREESTNMTTYCNRFGFDVVADLRFGESLKLQTDPQYRWMIRWLEVAHVRNNTHIQAPTVKWLGLYIPLLIFLIARGDKFNAMVDGLISRRMERGIHSREDFFSLMLDSKNPTTGKATTIEEFTEEVMFFFPAGTYNLLISRPLVRRLTSECRRRYYNHSSLCTPLLSLPLPRLLQTGS